VHRDSSAGRQDLAGPPSFRTHQAAGLHEAESVDLTTLRLVLRQHLDDLRARGVSDAVLRPIEAELRRFDETVDELIRRQSTP
jgi:hypothetical protein